MRKCPSKRTAVARGEALLGATIVLDVHGKVIAVTESLTYQQLVTLKLGFLSSSVLHGAHADLDAPSKGGPRAYPHPHFKETWYMKLCLAKEHDFNKRSIPACPSVFGSFFYAGGHRNPFLDTHTTSQSTTE